MRRGLQVRGQSPRDPPGHKQPRTRVLAIHGINRRPRADPSMPRLLHKSFAPVDISWLAFFRIIFGCVMLVEVVRYFAYDWIAIFNASDFRFGYYAFEWVRPWPDPGMHIHFAVLGVAAVCLAAGFCYRVMAAIFFVGFTYVFL